jgi:hypothetical protein
VGSTSCRRSRDISPTVSTSSSFESTGPWRSPFAGSRSPPATCTSDGFVPTPLDDMNRYRGRMAIARPLAVRGTLLKPFASYETFYEPTRVEQRENLDWRHGASQQAGVRSAVIHVGNQRRKPGRPLPVVRPDRQHAITPYSSSIHCERRLHVESIATRSRHRWRC